MVTEFGRRVVGQTSWLLQILGVLVLFDFSDFFLEFRLHHLVEFFELVPVAEFFHGGHQVGCTLRATFD
ncbi:hypothetical protein ACFQH6_19520 [Halobacteriaceae archaeon GCM10025711]